MRSVILLLDVALWSSVCLYTETIKNYNGYKVYRLVLDTTDKLEYVKHYDEHEGYDFWILTTKNSTHLMVPSWLQPIFENDLKLNKIKYKILNKNVGKSILNELKHKKISTRAFNNSPYDFTYFPRYDDIVNFMKYLTHNSKYSTIINIGYSFEGRPILGIEVVKFPNNSVFLIDAGMHAREWASHVSALYIMKRVVENEDTITKKMNFVIIPCINPDGYEYSHTTDRLWRKSRSKNNFSNCKGVDLNRNFDSHWGEYRAPKHPCVESFSGLYPFSEPESVALASAILYYRPSVYVTFHSFGALLLYPWGFSKELPPNHKTLDDIAQSIIERLKLFNRTNYIFGTSSRVLYEASGASDDWAMEKAGVPIVYTIELPEYDNGMFIIPKNKIKPLVRESFEIFTTILKKIQNITCNKNTC